jgi:hypothetical protein
VISIAKVQVAWFMWSVEPLSQTDEAYALRVILDAKNREIGRMTDEIARLKAQPTAAQERAAIVAWLRRGCYTTSADRIERGEHWPQEEKPGGAMAMDLRAITG